MEYLIGVDVGGTQLRVAIAPIDELQVDVIVKNKHPTPKDSPNSISNRIIAMAKELLSDAGVSIKDVISLSIATAGPIDMEKGEVFNNANLGFKVIPLREPISRKFPDIPINIINDCNGAVLGVRYFEALESEKNNLAYVTISTGIGGGVIANGHLVLGKDGNAAEVGHGMIYPGSGVICNCGGEGCWEAFSSGTAVAKHARQLLRNHEGNGNILLDLVDGNIDEISAKEVYAAAKKGDDIGKAVVKRANFYNAMGLGLINNFYDCKVIYLGGSMMKDADLIVPWIKEQFIRNPIHFTINNPPEIKVSRLGDDVGLLGALALGKYKIDKDPVLD
ncbi:MAG: ROK family protein [Promethearchaeota archaeon]